MKWTHKVKPGAAIAAAGTVTVGVILTILAHEFGRFAGDIGSVFHNREEDGTHGPDRDK